MENENKVELKQGNIPFANFIVCSTKAIADIDFDNKEKKVRIKPTDLKSGAKEIIVETVHISCQSDFPTCGKESMGGIILYSLGSLSTSKIKWKPGYIYVKTIPNIEANKQKSVDEGQIHGTLCRMLLGYQPSDITNGNGCLSGFSLTSEKVFVGNSVSCNTKGVYTNDGKSMKNFEAKIIEKALKKMRKTKERTFKVEDLV